MRASKEYLTRNISYVNCSPVKMHRKKINLLIASWLAGRNEKRARHLRRALRDYERAELQRIQAADRRARGLRLYAAWSPKGEAATYKTVVPLLPAPDVEERVGKRAA
jgi:hypothetical protein